MPNRSLKKLEDKNLPQAIKGAGNASAFAYEEFLFGQIRNANTRRAYESAINRFLDWLKHVDLPLVQVSPRDVGDYLDGLELSVPSKKLHRAALNHFFDFQVQRHAVVLNPVSSVRNERHQVAEGKTPEITVKQAQKLFQNIETDLVGLRDRTILAVLAYSGTRIGAVSKLRRQDLKHEGDQWVLSFRVATITNLLTQGVPLEDVQNLANHADPRTTRLYDRRRRKVTRNIVERIPVYSETDG